MVREASVHEEDMRVCTVYAPSDRTAKHMKRKPQGCTEKSIVTAGRLDSFSKQQEHLLREAIDCTTITSPQESVHSTLGLFSEHREMILEMIPGRYLGNPQIFGN